MLYNKSEVKFESNDRTFSKQGIETVGDNSISDRQHLKQMFPEKLKFWSATLKDSSLPNIFRFVFVFIDRSYILFSQMKKVN